MNTVSVLFIAAMLVMAASAPNNKKVIKTFNKEKQDRLEWQSIVIWDVNILDEPLDFIAFAIFDIFPNQLVDPLRMQELVANLDSNPGLATLCPAGNRWSVFGFKLCEKDYVLGSPDAQYFVFHYSNDEDLDGAGYALYNDCK